MQESMHQGRGERFAARDNEARAGQSGRSTGLDRLGRTKEEKGGGSNSVEQGLRDLEGLRDSIKILGDWRKVSEFGERSPILEKNFRERGETVTRRGNNNSQGR